jgi:hypothetical protein
VNLITLELDAVHFTYRQLEKSKYEDQQDNGLKYCRQRVESANIIDKYGS